jgi:hypothetical protein
MDDEDFAELLEAAQQALEYSQGLRDDLRVTTFRDGKLVVLNPGRLAKDESSPAE